MQGEGEETLIIWEHDPVITIGRSAKEGNLIASPEHLAKLGIEALEIERGRDFQRTLDTTQSTAHHFKPLEA
ncbi:MAG: hypothetical protein RL417_1787 [Pseudomonadota bacterium]|jgi:lipoyl(octanoyl) transferase